LCCALSCNLSYASTSSTPSTRSGDIAARSHALAALLAEEWQYQLEDSPELATRIGDYRYNDRWSDYSIAHVSAEREAAKTFLMRFKALDAHGLSEQQRVSWQMMVRQLEDELESIRLKDYEMPFEQIGGLQLHLPGFIPTIPFSNTRQYQDYLKRLQAIPRVLDDLIAVSRQGMEDGLVPPRYLLETVAVQCNRLAEAAGIDNVFGQPAARFPDSVSAADQVRLRQAIVTAVDEKVRPAYRKLAEFVAKDYAPHGRTQEGVWALPDGDERYRFAIHTQTSTELTPAQIHQIGLDEVKRIEGEMSQIALSLGYQDLESFRAAVIKDPKLYAISREQILDEFRHFIAGMQRELPKLFGRLPKTQVEVRPVERYREKNASTEYHQGTPDGSRPGIVFVNTGDYSQRLLYTDESTAYHEGVPGHHLQLSIAQSLPLPPFRQQAENTAYEEGWALYAEGLAKEAGFYKNRYSDYGRLSEELLRADRLVLDTGVHYLHWTRAQMVDYFHAHPAEDEPSTQAEVDRYIVWPGQALGYKLGQLKFLQLRSRAQKALGPKFDIRAFHDEMRSGGELPLDLLDARTNSWIAAVQAGKRSSSP
jgi:uncharacterized protein (DUF885 family)